MFGNIGQPIINAWQLSPDFGYYNFQFDPITGTFVRVARTNLAFAGIPFLENMAGGDINFFAHRILNGDTSQQTIALSDGSVIAAPVAHPNINTKTQTFAYAVSQKSNAVVCVNSVNANDNDLVVDVANVAPIALSGVMFPLIVANVVFAVIHPTDDNIIVGTTTGCNFYLKNGTFTSPAGDVATFASGTPHAITLGAQATVAKWSADGTRLLVGDVSGGITAFDWDGVAHTLTQASVLASGLGSIVDIAIRFDGTHVAASGLASTTYTTAIYYLLGPLLFSKYTIVGMGQALDFTGGGNYLIDALSLKAQQYLPATDTFVDASSILTTNLPSNLAAQSVNQYIPDTRITGYLYDGIRNSVVGQIIGDFSTLKLMLLNSTAVYKSTDTAITDVNHSGDYEVSGNNWPQGGVVLSNVSFGLNAETYTSLKADPVKQITKGSLTYRSAVIYDSTSGKPVAFYDFGSVQTSQQDITMVFDLSISGIVQFRT